MALHLESCLSSLKPKMVPTIAQFSQSFNNLKLDSLHIPNKWSINIEEEERRTALVKQHVSPNFNLLLPWLIFF